MNMAAFPKLILSYLLVSTFKTVCLSKRMSDLTTPIGAVVSKRGYSQQANNGKLTMKVLAEPTTPQATTNSTFSRYVIAHILQGDFQHYQAEDWSDDMALAKRSGVDAFAINIGRDETNNQELPLIYEVAEQQSFAVYLSFDMHYYGQPGSSKDVVHLIQKYSRRKSNFIYQGKPVVACSSGEVPGTFLNNDPSYDAAWQSLKREIGFPIYFLPTWTSVDPWTVPSADGLLSWDAWSTMSSARDRRQLAKLKAIGKQYAAPISPFFYKHLSPAKGGNYIYPTDSWFVVERYLDVISSAPDLVELLSWNNYGESHYFRDPRPSANLPVEVISSQRYVDGMSHEPILDLLTYFNEWYKSGSRPLIASLKAYMWYRPHSKYANATSDPLPYPDNASDTEDKIYIVLMVPREKTLGQVEIVSGESCYTARLEGHQTTEENGSILLISSPFVAGHNQSMELFSASGLSLGRLEGIPIIAKPELYNFNYWSGMMTF